ncbi:hypothetical protein GGX14DRAFT_483759 [Mycena pura]|uniref:DUF6534 domain-containing protein n=1 Tax=Mycena pura TaxID=153505 RepID=A0AAD6ULB7_9AGAR|nr:hypothetical protein GGX14DRAFT_483759 [Mycena pura]
MASVALTYGPILFGGAVAFMLSGVVAVQCIIFFKLYPDESSLKIAIVAAVWTLDVAQTSLIIASLFSYFIVHFGDLAFSAMQTCVVHLFYAAKIFRSSQKNWYITLPIVCLALLRLLSATGAVVEILRYRRWTAFASGFPRFLFTMGLTLSAATDAIITLCLMYYLRKIRRRSATSVMKGVLDTLTLYTLENGLVTWYVPCWLISRSSIALSLHFVIGKLYPNSLLVLLNTRKSLRQSYASDCGYVNREPDTAQQLAAYYKLFPHRAPHPSYSSDSQRTLTTPSPTYAYAGPGCRPSFMVPEKPPVQVKVERTVVRTRYQERKRRSERLSIISDAPSFDLDEAAAADPRRYAYPKPTPVSSLPSTRSLGMSSLHLHTLP